MTDTVFTKQAAERLDYDIDYKFVIPAGDSIASSSRDVSNDIYDSDSFLGKITKIWLANGTVGDNYTATNTVTTAQGRIFVIGFILRIV